MTERFDARLGSKLLLLPNFMHFCTGDFRYRLTKLETTTNEFVKRDKTDINRNRRCLIRPYCSRRGRMCNVFIIHFFGKQLYAFLCFWLLTMRYACVEVFVKLLSHPYINFLLLFMAIIFLVLFCLFLLLLLHVFIRLYMFLIRQNRYR